MKDKKILIAGAGLCGSLMGLRLAQRGYDLDILERRPDPRKVALDAGRSINLALSARGMAGMKLVGLEEEVKQLCIPMHGRMLHDTAGNTQLVRYSGREDEWINSISRSALNELLLQHCDKLDNVRIDYNDAVTGVDLKNMAVQYSDSETNTDKEWKADVIIGADGAGSRIRKSFVKQRDFLFSHATEWLPHGYKELEVPAGPDGSWLMDKHALHIWPRGGYMVIALPNLNGSFTVTLFLQYKGEGVSFDSLKTKQDVNDFFAEDFADLVPLIPDLADQFFENPTPPLGTIRCSPWKAPDQNICLVGDASHAIVPFYGQGMNSSFEDVVVMDQLLDEHDSWEETLEAFSRKRKPNADAIAQLALENFIEMRDSVANPDFQRKRVIEMKLEQELPTEYNSKYSLVTFRNEVPYHEARRRGLAQNKAILWLLSAEQIDEEMPARELLSKINKKTSEVLHLQDL